MLITTEQSQQFIDRLEYHIYDDELTGNVKRTAEKHLAHRIMCFWRDEGESNEGISRFILQVRQELQSLYSFEVFVNCQINLCNALLQDFSIELNSTPDYICQINQVDK
mgnify:CR=1 FL=1